MRNNLFVFNIPVEKAVFITLRTLQLLYTILLLSGYIPATKYPTSEKKTRPYATCVHKNTNGEKSN